MASCGVTVNLSAIESSVTAHLGKLGSLAGICGIPYAATAITVAIALSRGSYLAAINVVINTDGMLDSAWEGMRSGFGELVGSAGDAGVSILSDDYLESIGIVATGNLAAPLKNIVADAGDVGFIGPLEATFAEKLTQTVNDWGGKVTKFADETGLSSLSGYVNINALDLAKSSIGMGASFDECDFGVSGIGNYFSDPATGAVKLLSNYNPALGDTSMPSPVMKLGMSADEYFAMQASAKVTILGQQVSLKSVYSSFVPDEVTNLISISAGNVSAVSSHLDKLKSPAKGAYGDGVRRLASGEMVVENAASALDRLQKSYVDRMPSSEYAPPGSTITLSAFAGSTE
jgi:hypothetical protein